MNQSVQKENQSDLRKKERIYLARIARTRNLLSHGLPPDEKYIPHGVEFQQAIRYLNVLHQGALMEIMELSQQKIDDFLLKRYRRGI